MLHAIFYIIGLWLNGGGWKMWFHGLIESSPFWEHSKEIDILISDFTDGNIFTVGLSQPYTVKVCTFIYLYFFLSTEISNRTTGSGLHIVKRYTQSTIITCSHIYHVTKTSICSADYSGEFHSQLLAACQIRSNKQQIKFILQFLFYYISKGFMFITYILSCR